MRYTLKVSWLPIWRAKLMQGEDIIISELLPKRRRRSLILLGYSGFMLLAKAAFAVIKP